MLTLSTPIYYALELTPECNNHCPGCSNIFQRSRSPLPWMEWEKILNSILPHAELVKITGGEPTLHPEFEHVVRKIAENNVSFTIFTNARWNQPDKLIQFLKDIPQLNGLLISLHGASAATHEKYTYTPGSFHETCQNIKLAAHNELNIHISTVLTRENIKEVDNIVDLAQNLGTRRVVFNRYIGREADKIAPNAIELRQALHQINKIQRQYETQDDFSIGFGNCIPQCFERSEATGCWAGVAYATIDPWGNLRPCSHSPTIAGNILQTPIAEIWQNEKMQSWRKLYPEKCHSCDLLEECHGGCKAQAEILNMKYDPLIQEPIQLELPDKPSEIALNEASYPILDCKVQQETFGFALIDRLSFIPVVPEAKSILDELNGQKTLREIKTQYGQDALDFVGTLFMQGMVKLVDSATTDFYQIPS